MKVNFMPTLPYIPFRGENSNAFYEQYEKKYDSSFHKDLREALDEYFKQNQDINRFDIKGFAGHGGLTTVFDLGEKGVLKCSKENPLEFRKHNLDFDIPFKSPVTKVNNFYIVIQPKADISYVTKNDCVDVLKRMSKEGFEPSRDFKPHRTDQVGIYNGKAYLLDTRCALPKPNKFSLEIYNFCQRNKRVFQHNLRNESVFGHVVEIPRANLSVKEAKLMIKRIIKDNKKYGYPPLHDGFFGLIKLIIKCFKYNKNK